MALRLPSLERVAAAFSSATRRFPEVSLLALVAACAAVAAVDSDASARLWSVWRVASLGVPLFLAIALFWERRRWGPSARWVLDGLALGLVVALYAAFERWEPLALTQRYLHLAATLHLVVAVAPHLAARQSRGFWNYNCALLFRFLLATVYALVLFAGLAVALAAVDNLLGVDVADPTYARLFLAIAYGFHPIFFLAGVPADFAALEERRPYPTALRVLAQWIMLPLVALYLAILTAYTVRILATGVWPDGWTGYLVTSLAAVGILALLLIHPERADRDRRWLDRYAFAFWVGILPSAAMALAGLWQRVALYGFTERRFLLGVLALWLIAVALHRAITRTRAIEDLPLALAVVGALTFAGPLSAYRIAERSQVERLGRILERSGAPAAETGETREIPFEDWGQARDAARYLLDRHGRGALDERWGDRLEGFDPSAAATARPDARDGDPFVANAAAPADRNRRAEAALTALGARPGPSSGRVEVAADPGAEPVMARSFDLLLLAERDSDFVLRGEAVRFELAPDSVELVMRWAGAEVARASLAPLIARARAGPGDRVRVPRGELALALVGEPFSARVVLGSVSVESRDGGRVVVDFDVDAVLVRLEALRPARPDGDDP